MSTLSFRNVHKRYPSGVHAVRDFNLEIADGELVVLVGPSGCGKSTTLRMLAGLEEVTSGEILIDDQVVNRVEPRRRDVAMVFQNFALYPHMTVRQNLAFGLKMRRTPRAEIERRTLDAAGALDIAELLDRRPAELSGGERQRVALGRAIVRQPRVFLFDEPLSNLDARLRVQMRAEIAALHRRLRTTTIYVTHDQAEAMTLGQRIVVMDEGVVQQADAPRAIYRNPANRFVAGFMGSPPMNFIRGRLQGNVFRHAAGEIRLADAADRQPAAPGAASAQQGVAAWLGIRPEDLTLDALGPPLGEAMLHSVEPLGHESLGCFQFAGEQLVIRLPADSGLAAGDRIHPHLRPAAWRLFADDAAGNRLA